LRRGLYFWYNANERVSPGILGGGNMSITIEAVYANGTFQPRQPLQMAEGTQVELTIHTDKAGRPPIWERIIALTADAPPEELAKAPTDGASQHDHYLYGTPKRPE
jgi:predicted DNA-binding antitoxin AbrB/MazE fold protein